jgi:hypothetical protein
MKILFSVLSFVAMSSSLSVVACSSAPGDTASTTDEASKVDVYACKTDDDCVAIPAGGCCPNGTEAAVNEHHIRAYNNAHECTNPPRYCPLFVVHETRVAECDNTTNKCVMIQPEDIRCGGFTRNAHSCPSGYSCDLSGHVPDVPGVCKVACPPNRIACLTYQHYDSTACGCVDNPHCGGIAGIQCPSTYATCEDDPRDSCDPNQGGRDCGGICMH